jgi:hypothetical protein
VLNPRQLPEIVTVPNADKLERVPLMFTCRSQGRLFPDRQIEVQDGLARERFSHCAIRDMGHVYPKNQDVVAKLEERT